MEDAGFFSDFYDKVVKPTAYASLDAIGKVYQY